MLGVGLGYGLNFFKKLNQGYYSDYLAMPENTDEECKKKLDKGEEVFHYLANQNRNFRIMEGVFAVAIGAISFLPTNDITVFSVAFGSIAIGYGTYRLLVKDRAERERDEYRKLSGSSNVLHDFHFSPDVFVKNTADQRQEICAAVQASLSW